MFIKTRVLDEKWNPVFEAETEVDAIYLMLVSESREELVRSKGADWAAGAIPFFGQELINAMKSGQQGHPIEKAAIEVAMAAWLFDSIYGGLDAEAFVKSNLEFTMMPGGAVKYDRRPSSKR